MLLIALLVTALGPLWKSKPRPLAQPRPGFPGELLHPELGTFPLSRESPDLYERVIDWCGVSTRLCLSIESIESIDATLQAATTLTKHESETYKQVCEFATNQLLPSVNEERQALGVAALDAGEFRSHIVPVLITVHSDNTYEFLFDDGGLFGGHWVEVHGSMNGGPIEVDLPG